MPLVIYTELVSLVGGRFAGVQFPVTLHQGPESAIRQPVLVLFDDRGAQVYARTQEDDPVKQRCLYVAVGERHDFKLEPAAIKALREMDRHAG